MKTLAFVIGIPVFIFAAIFLLISIVGFGWEAGSFGLATLLSLGLLILSVYLFYRISSIQKKQTLWISVIILFISLFSSIAIIFSSTR